jgi:signal transduction histidine kinase
MITVVVQDNGKGFDVSLLESRIDEAQRGLGLFNVRKRLEDIGGYLHIQSTSAKGTCVTMTEPIG